MSAPTSASDGFKIFCSEKKFADEFETARKILLERSGEILGDRMDAPKRKRLIIKAQIAGTPVVLKRELFVFRFDRSIKAFLFGSDAKNIFKLSCRARERGFTKIPKTFLVAEKFSGGILRETISVTEFLEGRGLRPPFPPALIEEVRTLLTDCHANGIISGDVQFDNFMVTPDGVKLIDFRGNKVFPWLAKARDRLQLEFTLGIPAGKRNFAEKFFLLQNSFRNFCRKLRGKPPQHS